MGAEDHGRFQFTLIGELTDRIERARMKLPRLTAFVERQQMTTVVNGIRISGVSRHFQKV